MNHIKWYFLITAATVCNKAFADHDHSIHFVDADNSLPRPLIPSYFSRNEKNPMETMIDVTNNLAYRILVTHSFLNRNNFAFSPSELMGVLAALYEAADENSSRQIANTLALPLNSDNLRIGYRDIFMKLKTYLYKTDPPLQSLKFNRDNITIHKSYEDILNFYGFDLAADMIISRNVCNSENTSSSTETTKETSSTTTTPIAEITTTTTPTTTMAATPSATAELVTSTSRTFETTTDAPTTLNESEMSSTQNIEDASGFPEDAEIVKDNNQELLLTDNTPLLRLLKSDNNNVLSKPSGKPMASLSPPPVSYLPSIARSAKSFHHRLNAKNERSKRFIQGSDFYEYVALIQPQPETQKYHSLGPISSIYSDGYHLHLPPNFVTNDNTRWTHTTEPINDYFLLPDNQAVRINFKIFNSMALFRYFNHLGMAVLELEMNDPETSLMILLPDAVVEPMHTAESLLRTESLRKIRSQLRATWVQALIPDFKLYGTMFLTNDLQNLRVCDIFEPHRADFSSMTNEKGIYVRHIEQTINISISSLSATINNNLKLNQHHSQPVEPIHFYVNRQFFFFVIDKGLGVATMAGRILNPLNVRIQ